MNIQVATNCSISQDENGIATLKIYRGFAVGFEWSKRGLREVGKSPKLAMLTSGPNFPLFVLLLSTTKRTKSKCQKQVINGL